MKKISIESIIIVTFFWFKHSLIFSQCENFEMTFTTWNPTCPGYSDGSITVNQTGGTGMVSGEITNSAGQLVLTGGLGTTPNILSAGWYYIYLIDESGCELFDSVYIADPDEMEIILNITLPSSVTACDGIAEVDTVLFHNGNYNDLGFFWSGGPGGIGQTIKSDLCYGDYTITVNNDVGCGTTLQFTVGNLSTKESVDIENLSFYPNPFLESTTIQVEQSLIGETMFIYNQLGVLVRTFAINDLQTTIYREQLSAGIYFYKFGNIQGKLILE